MVFKLTSPAFGEGQPIPVRYTSDGQNVSPPLEWSALKHAIGQAELVGTYRR